MNNLSIKLPIQLEINFAKKAFIASNNVSISLHGLDISFGKTKVFIRSKSSFLQLFSYFSNAFLLNGLFLEIALVGLGFRLIKLEKMLLLKLGHAHYFKLLIPDNLIVFGSKKRMILFGLQIGVVNQFAEKIVGFRAPDVYKKKGVQIVGRFFRLKPGKQK